MQWEMTRERLAARSAWGVSALKVAGLTLLLTALLSVDYIGMTISRSLLEAPVQLIFVAFADTLILNYFVRSSRLTGWKEWGALFALFYGVNYPLVAMESAYLGNIFSPTLVLGLVANGAIATGVFAAVLVWSGGERVADAEAPNTRLMMRSKELAWKIAGAGAAYLLLFVLFGFAVYIPIARMLDPIALAREQSVAASSAALVFPVELLRGALWALLAVPAVTALRFGWKKTALVTGLLFAVPMSGSILISTTMATGLQIAHLAEVFGENLAFGLMVVLILQAHSRLSPAVVKS